MKIKNIAFFGIMASIIGLANAARADGNGTIIASQGYVDAQVAPKEDSSNKETATYALSTNKTSETVYPSMKTLTDAYTTLNTEISTQVGNISHPVTNGSNVLDMASSTNAPTIDAVKGAAQSSQNVADASVTLWDTTEASTSSAKYTSDTKVPTVKAVAQQISKAVSTAGSNVTSMKDNQNIEARNTSTNQLTHTPSTNDANHFPTTSAYTHDLGEITDAVNNNTTAIANKAGKGLVNAASTDFNIVKYSADGTVDEGKPLTNQLNNVNVTTGGSTGANACSAANPCVLTYIGGTDYRWTQMATEGLSAATGS